MKKKKYLLTLSLFSIVFGALTLPFTGCTWGKAGTESDLIGTYKLTTSTRRLKGEETATDLIETKSIVSYFVFSGGGEGYYVYQDDETPLYSTELKMTYEYSSQEDGTIITVRYDDGQSQSHLNVQANNTSVKLYFDQDIYNGAIIQINSDRDIVYTKISEEPTLKDAAAQLKTTLSPLPFEDYKYHGAYVFHDKTESYFHTSVLDVDMGTMQATYYHLNDEDPFDDISAAWQTGETVGVQKVVSDGILTGLIVGENTFSFNESGSLILNDQPWDFFGARMLKHAEAQYLEEYGEWIPIID